jgi:hypothetical protein
VTRSACARYLRDPWRRRRVRSEKWLDELRAHVRTETLPYLRTTTKDRLRVLRQALDPADQMLLTLRLDRELAWADVARVLHDAEVVQDDVELRRLAAACRKRYERLKEKLHRLAVAEGLVVE